jgi:hypothetical protein
MSLELSPCSCDIIQSLVLQTVLLQVWLNVVKGIYKGSRTKQIHALPSFIGITERLFEVVIPSVARNPLLLLPERGFLVADSSE